MKTLFNLVVLVIVTTNSISLIASDNVKTYQNEVAIEFKPNKGEPVTAYQGSFMVPENRNDSKSRAIKVQYVRFPATTKNPGNPIVYLSGGPGGSGVGTARGPRFPLFMAMREHGDVIALDQRGTGLSINTEPCKSSQTINHNTLISVAQVTEKYHLAGKECLAFWKEQGADILGYSSIESARDLVNLKQHLGADKVDLWGISYGSHLALTAMKTIPDSLGKVIIASVEGMNQTVKLPAETDAYFARIHEVINQNPELASQFPDIKQLMVKVHKQLEESPLPVTVAYKDGQTKDFLFQKWMMQRIASMVIADPGRYLGMLLQLYKSVDVKSTEMLSQILAMGVFRDSTIQFRIMPFGMDIASGVTDERLKKINAQAEDSLLGLALNFPMPHLNRIVPELDLGDDFRKEVTSDIPTLVLSGTLDGRTYMAEQNVAIKGLSKAKQVVVEHAGHNLYVTSPEVLKVMNEFMMNKPLSTNHIKLALPTFQ